MVAILGGKTPHIQNLAVGGVMNAINLDSLATLNMDRLYMIKCLFDEIVPFVQQVYFADACAIAGSYPEWFGIGDGVTNYLAVPDLPTDTRSTVFDLPGGRLLDGELGAVRPLVDPRDEGFRRGVVGGRDARLVPGRGAQHPWRGRDRSRSTPTSSGRREVHVGEGPALRREARCRSVRWRTCWWATRKVTPSPASGPTTRSRASRRSAGRQVGVEELQSTMGRYVAARSGAPCSRSWPRAIGSAWSTTSRGGDTTIYNAPSFPKGAIEGVGLHEAPRGTLSHWVVVTDGVLSNYQAVVPTTWNASPRDERGEPGPYEASLVGTPVADPERPLEILRTVHSFDPCMACACHTLDPAGRTIATVRVL